MLQIDGILFRIIDTAGIRETDDTIENLGIQRSYQQLDKAKVVLYITEIKEDHKEVVKELSDIPVRKDQPLIVLLNKIDDFHACHAYDVEEATSTLLGRKPVLAISAQKEKHLDKLKSLIVAQVKNEKYQAGSVVVSNARHHHSLKEAHESLVQVDNGLKEGKPSDLIALDLRHALRSLSEITGEVSTDDLLDNIFRNFCIGK